MNRCLLAPALLLCANIALPVMAAPSDTRVVTVEFKLDSVIRVDGRMGTQATIAFGPDEVIENVAIGDSSKWQITPNKRADLLFVKPLDATGRTNMTVITNRREYFFDLVAAPSAKPIYMLRFAYADSAGKGDGAVGKATSPSFALLTGGAEKAGTASDPASLNFAWQVKGDRTLFPQRLYDDGQFTYLSWPEESAIPALLVLNEQGVEGPVNYSTRGSTIVVPEVPRQIILRSGKKVAALSPDGTRIAAGQTKAATKLAANKGSAN